MPARLIYRCYRLPGQGYVTIADGDRTEAVRKADDAVLDAARQGKMPIGCTGIEWQVTFEGREATEILVFTHDLAVESDVAKAIGTRLTHFRQGALSELLAKIAEENPGRSAAIDQVARLLNGFARELSGELPAAARPQAAIAAPRVIQARKTAAGVGVAGTILLAVGFGYFWTGGSDTNGQTAGPSRSEIVELAELCYPGISKRPADIDRLVSVTSSSAWTESSGPIRNYLRALPPALQENLQQPNMSPAALCDARRKMWATLAPLTNGQAFTESMLTMLGSDGTKLSAMELQISLTAFTQNNAPPFPPGDCAGDICLPLVNEADIALKEWSDRFLAEILSLAKADNTNLSEILRSGEVRLRGELSLLGGEPKEAASNPFWSCNKESCNVPIHEAVSWLGSD